MFGKFGVMLYMLAIMHLQCWATSFMQEAVSNQIYLGYVAGWREA